MLLPKLIRDSQVFCSVLLLLPLCVHLLVLGEQTAAPNLGGRQASGVHSRQDSINLRETRDHYNHHPQQSPWTAALANEVASTTSNKLSPGYTATNHDDGDKQTNNAASEDDDNNEIYLESIEDLDHLSYLAMRNYNLTDERLLQSAWLIGNTLGGPPSSHKQHVQEDSATGSLATSDPKSRLAIMLESLMLHLRNGHLRRMSLDELEQTVNGQNLTESFESLRQRRHQLISSSENGKATTTTTNTRLANDPMSFDAERQTVGQSGQDQRNRQLLASDLGGSNSELANSGNDDGKLSVDNDGELRCILLVTLYKFELGERIRSQTTLGSLPPAAVPPPSSKVEYESIPGAQTGAGTSKQNERISTPSGTQPPLVVEKRQAEENTTTANPILVGTSTQPNLEVAAPPDQPQTDDFRLMKLCKLAVNCRSSDELVNLISRPWNAPGSNTVDTVHRVDSHETRKRINSVGSLAQARDHLERESSPIADHESRVDAELFTESTREPSRLDESNRLRLRKSLRDSVSLSLAKLCPLILFPLHEDDGQCMVRRDDRPPMITVWAFATLFVTIVCFCSLIGLSITPLLGHSATDSSTTGDSDTSGPAVFRYLPNFLFGSRLSPVQSGRNDVHSHKASLTLFEGLAVGSLVGSALFSLIPQAFELQERESNQSFLLKAFIIFSGIYLFFLSERIMRIILDTRQKRKRKKRLTHRGSTTAAAEMPGEAPHQHHLLVGSVSARPAHLSAPHHFHQSATLNHQSHHNSINTTSSFRQNSMSHSRPSTSSRGSGGKLLSQANQLGGKPRATAAILRVPKTFEDFDRLEMDHGAHAAPNTKTKQCQTSTTLASDKKRRSSSSKLQRRLADDDKEPKLGYTHQQPGQQRPSKEPASGRQTSERRQHRKRSATNSNTASRNKHSSHKRGQVNHGDRQHRKISASVMSRNLNNQQIDQKRLKKRRLERVANQANDRKLKRSMASTRGGGSGTGRPNSDLDDHLNPYQVCSSSVAPSYLSSSSSCSSSSSSLSLSSYLVHADERTRMSAQRNAVLANGQVDYDHDDYLSPSDSASFCSSCSPYAHDFCKMVAPDQSDSDDDNDQRRAVTKRMSELSHRLATAKQRHDYMLLQQQQVAACSPSPLPRTTFEFDSMEPQHLMRGPMVEGHFAPTYYTNAYGLDRKHTASQQPKERDISTVAWMIILGDGLHNFIDGISIGAAFSESILSGVSISVAVICEEFPHELGDFAVLVSSGMTIRQALGYNFLSACTCYFGMAVGIILGDVTDGASYISALAAGVFLYIALVDMMGELSAALEASSRESIARTLKLLLLQNVGIAIGISIIFVLSFIDF